MAQKYTFFIYLKLIDVQSFHCFLKINTTYFSHFKRSRTFRLFLQGRMYIEFVFGKNAFRII